MKNDHNLPLRDSDTNPNKDNPKKNKIFSLGNFLIFMGLFLLFGGIGYELANYPWGYKNINQSSLPDPKPIENTKIFDPANPPYDNKEAIGIMSNSDIDDIIRPQIELYQMGYIKIPRIAISENIYEGTGSEILYGVGHMVGTALPGQTGNSVLAGHRGYVWMHPFRHLDKIQIGDQIDIGVTGPDGSYVYTYKVFDVFEVAPDDTRVAYPQGGHKKMLTLITCTPLVTYNNRLIVWADLIEEKQVS